VQQNISHIKFTSQFFLTHDSRI